MSIEPNQTAVVDVGILLKFNSPDAHYPLILSDKISVSRGLIVNSFNSLADTDETVSKLEFTVYNSGKMPAHLKAGTPIARLLFVRTGHLTLQTVDKFPENEPTFKSKQDLGNVSSIPKTVAIWFRHEMLADRTAALNKFVVGQTGGTEYMKKIDEMLASKEYKDSKDPASYAARWIWDNTPDPLMEHINKMFLEHKRGLIAEARQATEDL